MTTGNDQVKKAGPFSCILCYETCPDSVKAKLQCGCFFCRPCLTAFLTVHARDRAWGRLRCPGPHESPILRADLKQLLPREFYLAYVRHVRDSAVKRDRSRVLCPGPECPAVCRRPERGRAVRCADCGLKFCCSCRSRWSGPEHKCAVAKEAPEVGAKWCPRCGVSVFREDGCNEVRCSNCSHSFCWLCLSSLEEDPLHFINGSCKGHRSEACVCRCLCMCTLGVLGLLISPFLILCSPLACLCPLDRLRDGQDWMDEEFQERRQRINRFEVGRTNVDPLLEEMTDEEKDQEEVSRGALSSRYSARRSDRGREGPRGGSLMDTRQRSSHRRK